MNVRARSGYLAVALPGKLALLAYEAPALAALEQRPAPTDPIVRTAALVFPEGSESQVVVLAATDANALRFARDTDADTYRADFTIAARILDASGAVVRKSSQPYRLGGSLADLDAARRGRILFFVSPDQVREKCTLEVAVHDALASHSGVRRSSFVAPAATAQTLQVRQASRWSRRQSGRRQTRAIAPTLSMPEGWSCIRISVSRCRSRKTAG